MSLASRAGRRAAEEGGQGAQGRKQGQERGGAKGESTQREGGGLVKHTYLSAGRRCLGASRGLILLCVSRLHLSTLHHSTLHLITGNLSKLLSPAAHRCPLKTKSALATHAKLPLLPLPLPLRLLPAIDRCTVPNLQDTICRGCCCCSRCSPPCPFACCRSQTTRRSRR